VRVSLHETAPTPYHLASAILIYRTEEVGLRAQATAVHHPVRETNGVLRFGEGTAVTTSVLSTLQELLDHAPLTYVPPNVVALGRDSIAWYEPAAPRVMFFNTGSDSATQRFNEVVVPQPPLVFVARARALRVFALRHDERPTLDTPLAAAPYWNVYEDGRVCTGSMRIPTSLDPSDTPAWTASFFGSNFTHMNTGKRWSYTGTYAEMLDLAIHTGTFNTDWLQEPCTTVRKALCG
jgi:PRTRC genetic system protein B